MSFISSARMKFVNNTPSADGPTTVLSNGDTFKLQHYTGDYRMVPKHGSGQTNQIESFANSTHQTTAFSTSAGNFYELFPPGFALSDGWIYWHDPGAIRGTGSKAARQAGAAYANRLYSGDAGSFPIRVDEHRQQQTSNEYEGFVMAAGCGVVAVGSWDAVIQNTDETDVLERDGASRTTKYVEIYSAGLKHKLFRIQAEDKRPYFSETVAGLDADGDTNITGYATNTFISSVAIGDNRIVVGYANHDVNGRDHATANYISTGLPYTRPGYVEVYSLDGRLLKTIRPKDTNTNTYWDDAWFGYEVAVGSGMIFVGAPQYNSSYGQVNQYDINGTLIREIFGIGANSCFGASLTVSGNLLIVGAPGYDTTINAIDKGQFRFYNIWTGSMVNSSYTGSANEDNLGHKGCIAADGDFIVFGDPDYSSSGYTSNGAVYIARIMMDKDSGTEYIEFLDEVIGTYDNQRVGSRVDIHNGFLAYCYNTRYDPGPDGGTESWKIVTRRLALFGSTGGVYDVYSNRHIAQTIGDYNPWRYQHFVQAYYLLASGGSGGAGGGPNSGPGGTGISSILVNNFQKYPAVERVVYSITSNAAGGTSLTGTNDGVAGADGVPYYDPDLNGGGAGGTAAVGDADGKDASFGGGGGAYGQTYYGGGGQAPRTTRRYAQITVGDTISFIQGHKGSGGVGGSGGANGGDGSEGRVYLWTSVPRPVEDNIANDVDGHMMHLTKVSYNTDVLTPNQEVGTAWYSGTRAYSRKLDRVMTNYNPYNKV